MSVITNSQSTERYPYTYLLDRIHTQIIKTPNKQTVSKQLVCPPPTIIPVGKSKTLFSNFEQICDR
eukprot:UN08148